MKDEANADSQQLSSKLEAANNLNAKLQNDLELQKQAWDKDVQEMTAIRQEQSDVIATLEQHVANQQKQIVMKDVPVRQTFVPLRVALIKPIANKTTITSY